MVDVAVVNSKLPASSSKSSAIPPTDHTFVLSPRPAATATRPPPDAIVTEPVVSGSVVSISVELSPPVEAYAPSLTLYTQIWLLAATTSALNVTSTVAVVPVG